MRRTKVMYEGRLREGEEVEFTAEKEDWSLYTVEDGTKLRQKTIAHKIVRLDDRNAEGEPIYVVMSSNVVVAHVQPHLMMER